MSGAQKRGQGVRKTLADAEVSLRRHDYEGVIRAARQALIADPKSGVAYRFLYEAYLYLHDFDRSSQARDNALRLLKAPNDAIEYEARGAVYLSTDSQRAMADYSEAIRLDPNLAVAYNDRGLAYADKKEYDRAIADFSEAIRLDPKYALAYYYRAVAYRRIGREDLAKADESTAKGLSGK
jgi:tetratricopeptide (TPR) repeat protein